MEKREIPQADGDVLHLMEAGRKEVQMQDILVDDAEIPMTIVPTGYEVKTHEGLTKKFAKKPARLKQHVEIGSTESFIDYLKNHYTDSLAIFCDIDTQKFVAILDYHQKDDPRWGDHTIELKLQATPQWVRWKSNDGKAMDQTEFALFIEDNMPEIHNPKGAEMLEVARSLQAAQSVNFRQSVRLSDGQTQIRYEETLESKAGEQGQLTIPNEIKLGIQLYRGSEDYAMDARFRYRIHGGGKLKMWYELVRPELMVEDAVNDVFKKINEGLQDKSFAIYHGKSPIDSRHSHY